MIEFDSHPELITCLSGTINLRTGLQRAHDPKDFITKCAPVIYDANAEAPRFLQFLSEIMEGQQERVDFLQRWFGYCITGETKEQKLVIHVGPGANGKSTLLSTIADVIGPYAHTAAPGLLTSTGERHPTEIADLRARRMVTAHESDDGAVLRESFVKQATGSDSLAGRYMFQDFFEFKPTHKLQLLTNHKPTVRGQDHAIWRRLLLVWYNVKFGTEIDVKAGTAAKIRDNSLADTLRAERTGIFKWLVDGARLWYAEGLRPPMSVLSAGSQYQQEQDRIAQFIQERCILDTKSWSPFSGVMGGLYPAYSRWCKENGYLPVTNRKFVYELSTRVPGYRAEEFKKTENGVRKSMNGCYGIRINTDEDGGGSVVESNEDLL